MTLGIVIQLVPYGNEGAGTGPCICDHVGVLLLQEINNA